MNARLVIPGVAAVVLLFAFLLWNGKRNQGVLESNLPPRIECLNEADARDSARADAESSHLSWCGVLGTGSMYPYLPKAPAGHDPYVTTVAYVVSGGRYEDMEEGGCYTYRNGWNNRPTIHGAAAKDSHGWIMSGLNNARSEAHWRVTPTNFLGKTYRVYVFPQ